MEKITSYGWPGNVRQLENVLKRAMVLCQGEWILEDQLLFEKGWERREAEEALSEKNVEDLLDALFEELSTPPTASPETGHDLQPGKRIDPPGPSKDQRESGPSRSASGDQPEHLARQNGEVSYQERCADFGRRIKIADCGIGALLTIS